MTNPSKRPKRNRRPVSSLTTFLWECRHHTDHSEIVAFSDSSDKWERIGVIYNTKDTTAKSLATFIVRLINEAQPKKELLQSALEALELCLEEVELTYSAEQAAEVVVARIKRVNG